MVDTNNAPLRRWQKIKEGIAGTVTRLPVIFLLGGLGALITLQLVPLGSQQLGPASVTLRVGLGPGDTRLVVPPVGTVEAATHVAPLNVQLELSELDFPALQEAVSRDSARGRLENDLESDLRSLAIDVGARVLVAAVALGLLVAALLPRRRVSHFIAGGLGGLVLVGAALGVGAFTWDAQAFNEPRFSGLLTRAPQVIKAVDDRISSLDDLRSRFEVASERLSSLLALTADPIEDPSAGTVAILHVSDIHSNPLGVEITRQLASRFDVDAVVDTGDITSFGQPLEAEIGRLLERFPAPYYYVPGNHDSSANRQAIDSINGVTMLNGVSTTVLGVKILGWADPTFTASNEVTTEEGNLTREESSPEIAESVEIDRPEVLAVHDERMATDSFGKVPLVLSGHTHEERFEFIDGTLLAVVGSTGATGLGSFTIEADLPYEAEVVYFRNGRPVALDYIKFLSLGSDFEVQRRVIDPEELTAEPGGPTPTPTPSEE